MTARLVAEFRDAQALLAAARQTRRGTTHRVVDAYTPFHVEGLAAEIDGLKPTRLPFALLAGGVAGALFGLLLQWISAVWILPVLAGGRAFASWPDFGFAVFEMAILGAALGGFTALLVSCGLPRLHHPLFDVPGFDRASQDRFFLEIEPVGTTAEGRAYLHALGAGQVHEVAA